MDATTELILADNLTFEQWSEIGLRIKQACTSFQFAIGDWLVYGEEKFRGAPALPGLERKASRTASDMLDYASTITGIDRSQLINFAHVARRIPRELRNNRRLSFRHYETLAKLPEHEQREWIALIDECKDKVSSRQLAHCIRLSLQSGIKKILSKEEIINAISEDDLHKIDAPEIILDRFIRAIKQQRFDEWTKEAKVYLLRRFEEAAELLVNHCTIEQE